MRPLALLAALPLLAALFGCQPRTDPIADDLVTLNAASQAAMVQADVQQAMARVQAAPSHEEKAKVLRDAALAIGKARVALQDKKMQTPEGRDLQGRMVSGFSKLGAGANGAADAFASSATADLESSRRQMREGQVEFIAAGQDMVRLATQRKIPLGQQ